MYLTNEDSPTNKAKELPNYRADENYASAFSYSVSIFHVCSVKYLFIYGPQNKKKRLSYKK